MSGEFGNEELGAFFHRLVEEAASDAAGGSYAITRKVGGLLDALAPLAKAISWAEAADTSEADAIVMAVELLDRIDDAYVDPAAYLRPFAKVAAAARRDAIIEAQQARA